MDGTLLLSLDLTADREIDPNRLFRFPVFNDRLFRRILKTRINLPTYF